MWSNLPKKPLQWLDVFQQDTAAKLGDLSGGLVEVIAGVTPCKPLPGVQTGGCCCYRVDEMCFCRSYRPTLGNDRAAMLQMKLFCNTKLASSMTWTHNKNPKKTPPGTCFLHPPWHQGSQEKLPVVYIVRKPAASSSTGRPSELWTSELITII